MNVVPSTFGISAYSVNQHFQNDQRMALNHLKIDLNATKHKSFADMVSSPTLQLTFRITPRVKSRCEIRIFTSVIKLLKCSFLRHTPDRLS